MTEFAQEEKELLEKLTECPKGTVIRKGSQERTLVRFVGNVVYYTVNSTKSTRKQKLPDFLKWAKDAHILL